MDAEKAHPFTVAIRALLGDLGPIGAALLFWSVVGCCLVLRGDAMCLATAWSQFYWTWVIVAVLHVAMVLGTKYAKARAGGPVIVPPPASVILGTTDPTVAIEDRK